MGAAKRRKQAGLGPRPVPQRVRRVDLDLPVELAETLEKLCPPKYSLRDWLVGALAAFAAHCEKEKERQDQANRLIVPAATMPKMPAEFYQATRTKR